MKFKWIRRVFSLLLCIVMLSTLIQVKEASATCYDHSKQNVKVTKEPTCTKTGTREYRCKNCNYLVKSETIPAKGHNVQGSKKTVNPTCTASGYTAIICSTCGDEVSRTTIPAKGHSWGSWKTTKNPTCTVAGTKQRSCTVCGAKENGTVDALGHYVQGSKNIVNPTCTAAGYTAIICSRCGVEVSRTTTPAKGHTWGAWSNTKNPTCTATGTKQRSCTVCGAKETGTVAALGHNVQGSKNIVNPTCTAAGYTAIICSRCGVEVSRTTTPAKGHTWGSWSNTKNPTCTATGTKQRSCTVCGVKETGTVAALGHNVQGSKKIVNPTCTEPGYTAIICSRCGVEVSKTTTAAKGHTWGKWQTTKDPTCTATGTKVRQCEVCKAKENGTVAALGHNVQGSKKIVNSTCTQQGYTAIICSRCGVEVSRTATPLKEHTWGKWQTTKDPTCTAKGTQVRQCEVCKKTENGSIPALGHNVQGTKKIVESTCAKVGYTAIICSRCGEEVSRIEGKLKEHTWGPWVEGKKRDCETKGERHRICSVCKKTESEELPELGHNVQGYRNVSPTCEEDGYSGVVCSRCSKLMDGAKIYPATGHEWGEWIIDKKPQENVKGERHHICQNCQKTEKEVFIPETITIQFDWGWDHSESIKGNKYATVRVNERIGNVFPVVANPKTYQIAGWIDSNGNWVDKNTIINFWTDQVLTAVWNEAEYYTIHFDGNGNLFGSTEDMTVKYGEDVILPKCGFDTLSIGGNKLNSFDAWGTSPDGKGVNYKEGTWFEKGLVTDKSVSCITLYALWKDCTVTYHDGISRKTLPNGTQKVGHSFTPKGVDSFPSLKIDGLTLVGWGTNPNGLINGRVVFQVGMKTLGAGVYDLYPVYEITDKSKRAVFFDPNGGFGGPGVVLYSKSGDAIVPEGVPTRTGGYTFDGWENITDGIDDLYKDYSGMRAGDTVAESWFENNYVRIKAHWVFNKRTLYLDYCDGSQIVEVKIEDDDYTLPKPKERKGFVFQGWGIEKDKAIYPADEKYFPAENTTTTLYAVWEAIQFPIEYYDSYTNELLASDTTDCTKKLAGNIRTIDGMVLEGWKEYTYVNQNGSYYRIEKFYEAGASVSELACTGKSVKLYSKYSYQKHDGILVVYHPNGGYSAPKAQVVSSYSEINLYDDLGVKKTGCDFVKWKSSYSFMYMNGKITGIAGGNPREIILTAEWVPNVELILDYGSSGIAQDDISGKYIPGHKISVQELSNKKWDGHYLQGWTDQSGHYYPYYGEITIPSVDTILTAVWGNYQYKIYYHNGFSGDLYDVPQETGYDATINYTPGKEKGYNFEGWVTSRPDEPPVDVKPKYLNDEKITISKDLHLYSCFSTEREANKIQVVYNNKGGKGGPGTVCFDRNPIDNSFKVAGALPTKEGYLFLGWSTSFYAGNVDYEPNSCYSDYIPEDGRITFYAVWAWDHTSDLKAEMQRRFGKSIMKDAYFDREYKSPQWQKINDYCYFVIKTKNEIDSDYVRRLTSTIMIIEFKNGKWEIESIGLEQSFSDSFRYYLNTHTNDFWGAVLTLGIDALECVVKLLPFKAKYILTAVNVVSMIGDFFNGDNDAEDFRHEYCVELYSHLIDSVTEQGKNSGMSDEEIDQFIKENYELLWETCEETSVEMLISLEKISGTALTVTEKSVKLVDWWGEHAESINGMLTEKFGKDIKLKSIKLDKGTGTMVSIFTAALGAVMDISRYSGSHLDVTGGQQNRALQAFHEELSNQGFSQDISNTFPEILVKMYKLYYGINY